MFRYFMIGVATAAFLTATACGQQLAMVQNVDLEQRVIAVKLGDVTQTVAADRVELRDQTGQPAVLADFVADQKVLVTKSGTAITRIQRANDARQAFARQPGRGAVIAVDAAQSTLDVKVGERQYHVQSTAVRLLDKDGKAAGLADFQQGEGVDVTVERDVVTRIQKIA